MEDMSFRSLMRSIPILKTVNRVQAGSGCRVPGDHGVKVYKVEQDISEVVSRVGSLIYTEQQLTDYLWGSALIWWRRATNK